MVRLQPGLPFPCLHLQFPFPCLDIQFHFHYPAMKFYKSGEFSLLSGPDTSCPSPLTTSGVSLSQSIGGDCTGSNGWVPGTPITCPTGYVISVITNATFGRPSGSGPQNSGSNAVCYGDGPTLYDGNSNCYFENVTSMAMTQCIGLQTCYPNFQVRQA